MRESNAQLVMRVLECEHHLPTGKQSDYDTRSVTKMYIKAVTHVSSQSAH